MTNYTMTVYINTDDYGYYGGTLYDTDYYSDFSSVILDDNTTYTPSNWASNYDNAVNDANTHKIEYVFNTNITSIRDYAFGEMCITSITIPDCITTIGDSCFNCENLTSITLPNTITSIGSDAFWACNSLTSISIPDSVTSIDPGAFKECYALTSVTLPSGLTTISANFFESCESLTSVTIPNTVTLIEQSAFYGCISLSSITLPNGLIVIESQAFASTSITSIVIPSTVSEMGDEIFYTGALESIYFSSTTPPEISEYTFDVDSGFPFEGTIYVPTGSISTYTSTTYYPSSSSQYDEWTPPSTVTLNESLETLGELMADNLVDMGVSGASASDGLTTLANAILDIPTSIGATNIVQGTFTTGSSRDTKSSITLSYSGSGYPIAVIVVIQNGAYNNTQTGNTTWYNCTDRYDVGVYFMVKGEINVAPTYQSSGSNNYGNIAVIYKGSTTNSTTYSRGGGMNSVAYNQATATAGASQNCVRFIGSGTKLGYYIGNLTSGTVGLRPSTTYQYIVIYSS